MSLFRFQTPITPEMVKQDPRLAFFRDKGLGAYIQRCQKNGGVIVPSPSTEINLEFKIEDEIKNEQVPLKALTVWGGIKKSSPKHDGGSWDLENDRVRAWIVGFGAGAIANDDLITLAHAVNVLDKEGFLMYKGIKGLAISFLGLGE